MKLAIATDIHLNFVYEAGTSEFIRRVNLSGCDAILLTGDIAEGNNLEKYFQIFVRECNLPVYFVLGNHDYWGTSVSGIRDDMNKFCAENKGFTYLRSSDPVILTPGTSLIGIDGWYDAGYGDPKKSTLIMNDWFKISDFSDYVVPNFANSYYGYENTINKAGIVSYCKKLAILDAELLSRKIDEAAKVSNTILIASHFPGWLDVSKYRGKPTDKNSQPYYISKILGDTINEAAGKHPDKEFKVFSGHTHAAATTRLAPNLEATVGHSDYGNPQIYKIIEL